MRIVVTEEISEDAKLRSAWNRLALQMDRPEIFYTFEWATSVQRTYKTSLRPLIFLGYEREILVGVVALGKRPSGEIVFLIADTGDYCDFLCASSQRQDFVHAVLAELRKRDVSRVILTNLPGDSPSVYALSSAAGDCAYHLHLRPAYDCARVEMGTAEEREALKQSVLAKKRLRRNIRELRKRGAVEILHETSWDEVSPVLHSFFRAHVARFLETGKISNFVREERRAFLAELASSLSDSGWLAMSRLLVGDVTAAWNYGFRFGGSWFWYQPTVNRIYGDFSPGYCLLAKIVELSCDSPEICVVDMGLGAEGYKERFSTSTRRTLYCELNQSASRHIRALVRYRAASAAKSSPRAERWIRLLIAKLGEVRSAFRNGSLFRLGYGAVRRLRRSIFSREDVFFFEWPGLVTNSHCSKLVLLPLDSELMGAAGIRYGNDPATMRFLIRSAQRLDSKAARGYALVTEEQIPVHFCWVRDFEGFSMAELNRTLHAPRDNASMIFDCFTPEAMRGHGFFSQAIAILAHQLQDEGKSVWIFGAATNEASLRGIRKSAFEYRFTLGRRNVSFLKIPHDSIPNDASPSPQGTTARNQHSNVNS